MDHEQFSKTLRKLRKKTTTGNRSVETVKIDARQIHASEEEFKQTNKGLVDNIFKDRKQINYNDFLNLRSQIHEDLIHYDFFTNELDENDTISIEDFLKSTITCVNPGKHNKYLKQISKVVASLEKEGEAKRVSFDEYLSFQLFLDDIEQIKRKVAQLKVLDFDLFEEIFLDYLQYKNKPDKKGKQPTFVHKISPVQIKALFMLLDANENGDLEEQEVMDVLQPRQHFGQNRDQKAKEDAYAFFIKTVNSTKQWLEELIA